MLIVFKFDDFRGTSERDRDARAMMVSTKLVARVSGRIELAAEKRELIIEPDNLTEAKRALGIAQNHLTMA